MIELKFLRENPDTIRKDLEKRKDTSKKTLVDEALELDRQYREKLASVENLRFRRNQASQEINKAKKEGRDISKLVKEIKDIPVRVQEAETEQAKITEKLRPILMSLPNILHDSVPYGKDSGDNLIVREFGSCLLYTSPSPRDRTRSRMPSSA